MIGLARVRFLILAFALSTVLTLSMAYYWPIQDAYHPLNVGWNGCSKIASSTQNRKVIFSYNEPLPSSQALLTIIGPSIEFSKGEGLTIRRFLEGGGTVLLADDFGTGNELLEWIEVPARFSGESLADLLSYSKTPSYPLITNFSPSLVTVNTNMILTNHPSYIKIENSTCVTELATSSYFSFIDLNGDGRPEANATVNSYPILALAKIGKGNLVLASDPSLFINEMIDLYDNFQVFENLLMMGGYSLLLDVAHLTEALLTDGRIMLRDAINSVRKVVTYSSVVRFQALLVAILILSFLLAIIKGLRRKAKYIAWKPEIKFYT